MAIKIRPDDPQAHNNIGNTLQDLHRHEEALSSHAKAIALRPAFAEAHNNLGNALQALQRTQEALLSYAAATALKPDYAQAHYNTGNALASTQRMTAALSAYDRAVALQPDEANTWRARGLALYALKRYRDALASYRRAHALAPGTDWLLGDLLAAKRQICDWTADEPLLASIRQRICQGHKAAAPFILASTVNAASLQRKAAEIFAASLYPARHAPSAVPAPANPAKIHLAYISADFRDHAMMHVMIDLFACHDRSRFEVTALSLGPDTQDEWRQRAESAFDRFVDVSTSTDTQVVQLARDLRIDIAIDLMGYTQGHRTGLFSRRIAPLQVVYLGYPGTMGTDTIDYIIADRILIPDGADSHYSEKIVRLPDTYQVNTRRPIPDANTSRSDQGLPPTGFVFCCFNNNHKITPQVFASWMRILQRVPGSVLWLYEENPDAAVNLRQAAQAADVAPGRLIFGSQQPLDAHLARHRLADLALDTMPYNGHATTSHALWTGMPVLTCINETFAGRVAASLLTAIGLPDLITPTLTAYEDRAVELATHPDRLHALKARLHANRLTTPLFNTARFTRHLEAAYRTMHARAQTGLPPAAITVPACLARSPDHS